MNLQERTPPKTVLYLRGVSKRFPGVQALEKVNFALAEGEVVALLGANGAGKSTLIKILSGVYHADEGEMVLDGRPVNFRRPIQAYDAGIAVVHQETSLIPSSTVLENIFLGRERLLPGGILDEKTMAAEYEVVRQRFGLDISPKTKIRDLGAAQKKLVEIMKAVSRKSRILIMDEPTDALSRHEAETLFSIVRDLKAQGMSIIFITHFLDEVKSVADSATVLRDGKVVTDCARPDLPVKELVALMLGRAPSERAVHRTESTAEVELSVRNLGRRKEFTDVSFELCRGEVLGITGVVGSGKTELARVLAGANRAHSGSLLVGGQVLRFRTPRDAVLQGIGMTPEDRKTDGLILEHSIEANISLASLGEASTWGVVRKEREKDRVTQAAAELVVKYSDRKQKIQFLSGGNQQKCVLARWLLASPRVLVLDEPTRGIDVGAKEEIYRIVRALAASGKAVLYLSGDPDEVLAVSDRVLVMQKGRVKTVFETPPTEDELLKEMIEVTQ